MTRRRTVDTGLPQRVYERHGLTLYSIGYKGRDNKWLFRFQCSATDTRAIQKLRRDAARRVLAMMACDEELETVEQLIAEWFKWQDDLPAKSKLKRATSTMDENKREARNLRDVFGTMAICDIQPHHAYTYLDKCDQLGRGPKGNKEITLFQLVMQRAVRKGIIHTNPLIDIDKLPTSPSSRYVGNLELDLALRVGRGMGGAMHIAALALMTAYLCVRRSVETLDLQQHHIGIEGITWTNGKNGGRDYMRSVVIEWSSELRSLIDEALCIARHPKCTGTYVFGNLDGKRYTKGGWKKNLGRLMDKAEAQAAAEGLEFKRFSLQDLRPKGVSDKLQAHHTDTVDATLHTNERMVQQVYDRRRIRKATPTR